MAVPLPTWAALVLLTSLNSPLVTGGAPSGGYIPQGVPIGTHPSKTKALYIGGIFPMEGGWAGGMGCRPAVDMALEDINAKPDILPGYHLAMISNDSQCMPGLGMNVLYELLYNPPTKLMLLGPGCSGVSTFVGQAARIWNLVVLSYGSSSPALSNRERFPTFFRTHPSATLHNPTRVKLFKKFKWNRIATIQETQEVFTSTIEDLEERVKKAGIEIAVRTHFLTNPTNAVRNLKRQDARIIVGLFYEDMARRVFCEVYKERLYGPKYVWFIIGWYPDNWFLQKDPMVNCTEEQMKEAVNGHFTTEGLMLNPDTTIKTVSGQTAEQFQEKVEARIEARIGGGSNPLSVPGYVEAPLAYDAVWALALALHKTQYRLRQKGQSLEEFDYSNRYIMQEIYGAMNSTNFMGVSGRVAFNKAGDRITWTQIEQMWDGNYTRIGAYDGSRILRWDNKLERWPGDMVPKDCTQVVPVLRHVSPVLFAVLCLLASGGILASTACFVFNVRQRHRRLIRLSQPHLNNVLLAGCALCCGCVFLQGLDGQHLSHTAFENVCQARAWMLSLGFTLAFGSMFSKVWTLYRLTTRRKKEVKTLKEWEMYLVIGIFATLDVIVMTTWHIIDPLYRELESFPHEKPQNTANDIELKPQLEHCSSEHINIWLGVVFGYKGILLLFGILLAYETRNVKVKQINDSRFVGMSIYNVVVLCIITAPVTMIIGSHQDASFVFVAAAILLSSFLAMGLIFVPKMLDVWRSQDEGAETAALTDSNTSREEEQRHQRLLRENEELKRQIAEKEVRIASIRQQLAARSEADSHLPSIEYHERPRIAPDPGGVPSQRPTAPNQTLQCTCGNGAAAAAAAEAGSQRQQHTVAAVVSPASSSCHGDIISISKVPSGGGQEGDFKPDITLGTKKLASTTVPTVVSLIIIDSPSSGGVLPPPNSLPLGCYQLSSTNVDLCEDNTIRGDPSSDSALPTTSTAKSSKNSTLSEETYSESYC